MWVFHTLPFEASTLWFILIWLFFFLINIFFWTFISVLDKTTYSDFLYTFYCFISYLAQGPAVIQRRIVLPLGRAGNPLPPLLLCAQWLQPYRTLVIPWTVVARLLCPWDFPGKNTGGDCHSLLQGIFPNPWISCVFCLAGEILYHWATREATQI